MLTAVIGDPNAAAVRWITFKSPRTNGRQTRCKESLAKAFTTTSGPIPLGSPIVTAMTGFCSWGAEFMVGDAQAVSTNSYLGLPPLRSFPRKRE